MDVEQTLSTMRAAVAPEATAEARASGAIACRALLSMLEGAAPTPQLNPAAIANAISILRGVPPGQLLELAISKLRSALPATTEIAPSQKLSFHLVPMPGRTR